MNIIELPGFIDIHVHLRDMGQEYKEDFFTGTSAAIAGGFTTVIDMPNNLIPITSLFQLKKKITVAKKKTICDLGFYFGTLGNNLKELEKVKNEVFGLKLYLNNTTGNFLLDQKHVIKIFSSWTNSSPILLHAEEETLKNVIQVLKQVKRPVHICHVSSENELSEIIKAKKQHLPITCGVCAHHLFLTRSDLKKLKGLGMMKPPLKTKKDQDFLWKHMNDIDVFESDHAPHTWAEKRGKNPAYGVPGLETTLPLLLNAANHGKISLLEIQKKCYDNPMRIFHIKKTVGSKIIVDLDEEYIFENKNLKTKCGWTPFHGRKVKGRLKKVFYRGKKVFENGTILVKAGTGKIIKPYAK